MVKTRFGICFATALISLPVVTISADAPDVSHPTTLVGLRQLAAEDVVFNRCTSSQVPKRCWLCVDQTCGFLERLAYSNWSVFNSAFASLDGESLDCEVSGQAFRISINYVTDPPQITFQVPGRTLIIFHEARPVHLFLNGECFTNPANGPYRNMAFENHDGSPVDKGVLLDKMQLAYRITVEGWNVNDAKVSTVDLSEGLANAVQYCRRFAANALADNE